MASSQNCASPRTAIRIKVKSPNHVIPPETYHPLLPRRAGVFLAIAELARPAVSSQLGKGAARTWPRSPGASNLHLRLVVRNVPTWGGIFQADIADGLRRPRWTNRLDGS